MPMIRKATAGEIRAWPESPLSQAAATIAELRAQLAVTARELLDTRQKLCAAQAELSAAQAEIAHLRRKPAAPPAHASRRGKAEAWEKQPLVIPREKLNKPAPAVVIERHQCPACLRAFDSEATYNQHRCVPRIAETTPARDPLIPKDPQESAAELARLLAAHWPRPCPECWRRGYVVMLRGPASWDSHHQAAHGIKPLPSRPPARELPRAAWRCEECESDTFARSIKDPTICVRCAAEQKRAATA